MSHIAKQSTLCFLIKEDQVLLAMKKRGFGVGKWNGVGGKVHEDETPQEAAIREAEEEIGVRPTHLQEVARFLFSFPEDTVAWNQECFVYLTSTWEGTPKESEEMAPKWFIQNELPFSEMWSDDYLWLPRVLAGEKISGEFVFSADQSVKLHKIRPLHLS